MCHSAPRYASLLKPYWWYKIVTDGLIQWHYPCRCSFSVLTSDGLIHHVEISREPSASVISKHASNSVTALRKQFPNHVFCFDYLPDLSFLLIVGSAAGISSTGSSGRFYTTYFGWKSFESLVLIAKTCVKKIESYVHARNQWKVTAMFFYIWMLWLWNENMWLLKIFLSTEMLGLWFW